MNIKNLFKYEPNKEYNFDLTPELNSNMSSDKNQSDILSTDYNYNIKYMKQKYHQEINSDIKFREFLLKIKNKDYKAFIAYIDGMVDSELINRFILSPLMLDNSLSSFSSLNYLNPNTNNENMIKVSKIKKFDLESYIYNQLVPQSSIEKQKSFSKLIEGINAGDCALFVDTIDVGFDIDVKGFKQRSIDTPKNEMVIKGPQEAFVENIRTNTSLLRRIANNENLVIESLSIGAISNTKVAICYMSNIANQNLVNEVKYRLNNLDLDNLISTGQLEQLISDTETVGIPNILSTERPDKCSKFMMQGRIVILVNGNPYAIIAPVVLIDFLSSPEDTNLKVIFANFLKLLRFISYFITLLAPGIFIAVTSFHQELLPTELLFSILASRENVPFPIIFELIIMEVSFELIREAGLRVPSPIGSTLGIIGALILGDAAVAAHLVSPILIIVVAITGLSSFSIPDYTFSFHLRIYRFVFIFLGYTAGGLGIAIGLFVYITILCSMKSFGINFTSPITPYLDFGKNSYFVKPAWKQEKRESFVMPKKEDSAPRITKKWEF